MPADRAAGAITQRTQFQHAATLQRPTVTDILRTYAAEYLRRRGSRAGLHERSTLAQLVACRTATLGSHTWGCDTCGERRVAYNSCRNRFCPRCGGAKRAEWLERMTEKMPPVPHFHFVFTLPHELSRLILANRKRLYGLLFRTAWDTLQAIAADAKHLGADIGAVLVLHTWGQMLDHHPHLHAVVPGGGLSLDGRRWIGARSTNFFLPVKALSKLFRGKFLARLTRLRAKHELRLEEQLAPLADDHEWRKFITALHARDWVTFGQAPPRGMTNPTALIKYLARYVSGAAINDQRLLTHEEGHVTFRAKNYRQGRRRLRVRLSGHEFTRRFALHVLPSGFQRVRYYGLLAHRNRKLARCRELLPAAPCAAPATQPPRTDAAPSLTPHCPHCERGRLELVDRISRPPLWQVLLAANFLHTPVPPRPRDTS